VTGAVRRSVGQQFDRRNFEAELDSLPRFDVVFIHSNARRLVYSLAAIQSEPLLPEDVVPQRWRMVARIEVPDALRGGDAAAAAWKALARRTVAVVRDSRSIGRSGVPKEGFRDFILAEIREGALPNRARAAEAMRLGVNPGEWNRLF
jgi:hypothetical protein